jgi:hypothetical protein
MKHIYSVPSRAPEEDRSRPETRSKIRKKLSDGIIQMPIDVIILLNSCLGGFNSIPSNLRDLCKTGHQISMFRDLDPINLMSRGGTSLRP